MILIELYTKKLLKGEILTFRNKINKNIKAMKWNK